jgi:hypothetical protein
LSLAIDQLDGQHTLRPLLASFFSTFIRVAGGTPRAVIAWRFACLLAALLPLTLACLNLWRHRFLNSGPLQRITQLLMSRSVFLGSILLVMTMIRIPSLLLPEINVDESQFIASAQKLSRDPVFFRSVDCGTVGPVDIYPLVLPVLVGMTPDYASTRLVGLVIMFCSIWIIYLALARLVDDRLARLAVIPLVGILATVHTGDLRHYTSETPILILVSSALYCGVRIYENAGSSSRWFTCLGFLISLSFFAKMQGLPLVLAVASVAFIMLWPKCGALWWRALCWLGIGAAVPFVLNAIVSGAAGVWDNFWNAYVVANRAYVKEISGPGLNGFPTFVLGTPEVRYSLFALVALMAACVFQKTRLWRFCPGFLMQCVSLWAVSGSVFYAEFALGHRAYIAILGVVGVFLFFQCKSLFDSLKTDSLVWLSLLAVVLISTGIFSVYVPHRYFPHYLLLLLIPIGLGIASLLLQQPAQYYSPTRNEGTAFTLLFLVASLCCSVWLVPDAKKFADDFSFARRTIRQPEGDFIRSLSPAGGSMVVWGWDAKLYLAAGMLPATRDTNMRNFFQSSQAVNAYYRRRFLTDIAPSRPAVVVDAAAAFPTNLLLNQRSGIESVPEVAAYISQSYRMVGTDSEGKRYFVRKDLPTAIEHDHCSADAIRCFDVLDIRDPPPPLAPVEISPGTFLDLDFTPESEEEPVGTVFSNSPSIRSSQGVELQCLGGSEYRLAVGLGDGQRAFSRSIELPADKPARLALEFQREAIAISVNGVHREVMNLPKPMSNSAAPIGLRSGIRGKRRFLGRINLLEVRRR